jgi:cytochrome oxidase Cu insertion factor (SCO1/SenC/PrrC family)
MCGGVLALYVYMKQQRAELIEKKKRARIGKTLIGGPWQLVNHKGVTQSHEDYKGNWLLIYFGFTHCPDICPDEIEKMCKVVQMLQADKDHKEPIIPLFMSVDPARDTPERVRAYISDFSPQLVGFTGSVEQVAQAAKTFRVYHSQGPGSKDAPADYIVDHTVIIYLMDPEGKFVDYYGQNRTAQEIAEVIRLQIFKYEQARRKGKSTSWWPNSLF